MGYYNYHGRIKSRIANGELIGIIPSDKPQYAIILLFSTPPHSRPIKDRSLHRYDELLSITPSHANTDIDTTLATTATNLPTDNTDTIIKSR